MIKEARHVQLALKLHNEPLGSMSVWYRCPVTLSDHWHECRMCGIELAVIDIELDSEDLELPAELDDVVRPLRSSLACGLVGRPCGNLTI